MLAAELAKELQYLEIAVSRRMRSLRFGQNRSQARGSGYEFDSHRKYEVGEDSRRIDWNVSARMQELYLKRHFEEREVTVFVLVDVSRSMDFSTAAYSKRLRVVQIAATLGFSAVSDDCHFGLLAFSDQVEAFDPPRKGRGHLWRVLHRLYDLQPIHAGTDWRVALRFLRSQLRRASVVFLLSDFITDPVAAHLDDLSDLKFLARKHDVIPIVCEDRLETQLPFGHGILRFRSAESRQEMVLSLCDSRTKVFEALVSHRKSNLRDFFYGLGMECLFLDVAEPFFDPLMMLFERRRKV